ncbi:DUF2490 domain-containing protein [Sphingomonas sanxanigenens]|uniref:DUF2490 domain-containing protein n=1 Tax=Sphingomonas sanxanigenens DSM 19645 = NX02 TaxID=1123269 RepID=W0A8H9_9SPHN|nr:DUF2490 domain-containing protein [Sphingomonas sanxanigenens]AHE51965.1 hypothetical protein NX02_00995 [Sphingomonas sanxanigenens DSM 19645 = NX02]
MARADHRPYPSAIVAPLVLLAAPALAQQQDEQLWFQANTNVPIAEDVRVTLEQIARTSDRQDGLYQSELGALLGIRLSPTVELGLGYRWVGAHNGNSGADENRIRQQVVATFGPVTTRFRVDERFNPRGSEVGFRIRPLIRYNHRLGAKGLALFASHESFYLPNATGWGQRRGYERMRNIIGFTLPLGRKMSADLGYLNQFRPARGRSRAQMDHALSLQLTLNLQGFVGAGVND